MFVSKSDINRAIKLRRLVTCNAYEIVNPAEPPVKLSRASNAKMQEKRITNPPMISNRIEIHLLYQKLLDLKFIIVLISDSTLVQKKICMQWNYEINIYMLEVINGKNACWFKSTRLSDSVIKSSWSWNARIVVEPAIAAPKCEYIGDLDTLSRRFSCLDVAM